MAQQNRASVVEGEEGSAEDADDDHQREPVLGVLVDRCSTHKAAKCEDLVGQYFGIA